MVKTHNVKLDVKNLTSYDMAYADEWFDTGRVADGFSWPEVISFNKPGVILCYESDGSLEGCSGLVTYRMGGSEVTIAFSNPVIGTNKLGIGTGGKGVWYEMENHNYAPFRVNITLANKRDVSFECSCTGGTMNTCTITARPLVIGLEGATS